MKRTLKIALPFLVVVLGAGVVITLIKTRPQVKPAPRDTALPVVRVVKLEPRDHQFIVHAQGSVSPRVDIHLASEVAGAVTAVSPAFVAGGFFDAGETLVHLDPRDHELAVTRARAQLAEAEVQVQREEAEAAVARKEWESLGGGGPANALLLREPQLAEARARAASAGAILKQAELDLQRCQIRAPFAGRVWSKTVDVGQYVKKGDPVARIYSVDFAEVRLPLALEDLGFLDLPMAYHDDTPAAASPRVTLHARFGTERHEWTGRVVRTEGEIDPRTRMLAAVARVEDPYGRGSDSRRPPLAVGLFVDAEIQGRSAGRVILAPRSAMRGTDRLMVIDTHSQLRLRPVDVIRFERDQVVLRDDLQDGDRACVSPLDAPVDGMHVRVADEPDAPRPIPSDDSWKPAKGR